MKYNKNEITKVAFRKFLENGYESPIISDLQNELGMPKGAMYRHFKNKEELFKNVIDCYFFNTIKKFMIIDYDTTHPIPEIIHKIYRRQRWIQIQLYRIGNSYETTYRYYCLIGFAISYYTDFMLRFKEFDTFLKKKWKIALDNSIKRCEIDEATDTKLMSRLFTQITLLDICGRKAYSSDFVNNLRDNIENQSHSLFYLYKLMKKKTDV